MGRTQAGVTHDEGGRSNTGFDAPLERFYGDTAIIDANDLSGLCLSLSGESHPVS
jgi:hypothetical protein